MISASNQGSRRQSAGLHIVAAAALVCGMSQAGAATVTLCAEPYTVDLPGTPAVAMWGYRQVNAAADCPAVTAPRALRANAATPVLSVPAGDTTLTVTLINRLNVPTSIVIGAQALPTGMGASVMAADVVGATCVPNPAAASTAAAHPQNCRVRSFTGETAPGATGTYTFANLRPGSYLYQSGTHPQVQVQMGLAGLVKVLANTPAGYDVDAPVVLSEVDPVMHATIDRTLGTLAGGTNTAPIAAPSLWKSENQSTLNYAPRYFLVNGRVFSGVAGDGSAATDIPVAALNGQAIGLRLVNAGLQSRTLMLTNGTWKLINEDGFAYPAAREQATALVPAGKTIDAVVPAAVSTGATNRAIAFFDRRAGSDNFDGTMLGGQVARLAVTEAGPPVNKAPIVNAGADQVVATLSAALAGTVTDDNLPVPVTLTQQWSLLSGPAGATVTFSSDTVLNPTASFSATGVYTLRLTASDGALSAFDDVVVQVNAAPTVNAGTDQTVTLGTITTPVALAGAASDDGIPQALTTTWSLVTPAPGTVVFSNAAALNPNATFSAPGTYTLRLTANDGQLSVADTVVVTVNAGKHVADLDRATVQGLLTWQAAVTITVHNALHQPVANANVAGAWSVGGTGSGNCTTNASGVCTVVRLLIPNARTSVVYTVNNITGAAAAGPYAAGANHDPDAGAQASNGTTITVPKP